MSDMERISEQAAAWHLASLGEDMDWDGFTVWLEADPRHAAAYDEVALADALLAKHRDELSAADFEEAVEAPAYAFGWKRWTGAAIAASLVALLALFLLPGDVVATYRTQDASQTIALEDGSQIILAPNSDLRIEGKAQDHMALSGGAWFDIRHDPGRSLAIAAGPVRISDIGTRFDVQVNGEDVRVAVADGKVAVASQELSQPVELDAGRQLHFDNVAKRAVTSAIKTDAVGAWREGRLTYAATPLALVSADLSRYAGVELTVPTELKDRQFSGTLAIGDGKTAIRDLSQLMGLALVPVDGGYRLDSRAD